MKPVLMSLFCALSCFAQPKKTVDLIITNAQINCLDANNTLAEAMAIKNGRIVAIGSSADIAQKYTGKRVSLNNQTVYPGFYDPHSHFMGLGQMLAQADLVGSEGFDQVVDRLKTHAKKNPTGWVLGRGWDQNDWPEKTFPTKEKLDKAFPTRPVFLVRIDGHAAIVNQRAIDIAKLKPSATVDGGKVLLENGKLTGVLIDKAMDLVRNRIPQPSPAEKTKMLLAAERLCLSLGLTTVSEAGISRNDIQLIDRLQKQNILKIRDYAMVSQNLADIEYYTQRGIYKTDRLNVRSIKIYGDGALGSRGAKLIEPYTDSPAENGLLLLSKSNINTTLAKAYAAGFQANTHCIGDSANRMVLGLYQDHLKTKNNLRWRIEHAQVVHPSDLPIFGQCSIIPSVQSTHGTSDMYWAGERLGPERLKSAYAYQDLLKQNGLLANGSDFPVEEVNPILGFYAAVFRVDKKGFPEGGFQPENALTREQALRAMTIWAAYANFEDHERGSLEVGKMADFVVTDTDLLTAPADKVLKTTVLQTYIAGIKLFTHP